jgi:hypothetical protein
MHGTSASASKSSRYSTSAASNAAPRGVRKIAAMPPAVPATTSSRRSRCEARSHWPTSEPTAAPICIVGPSRPPAPPLPRVSTEVSTFSGATRLRTMPCRR